MNKDIIAHFSSDPIMHELALKYTLPEIDNSRSIDHALCASIVSQQLSVKAADTIYNRFLDLFRGRKFDGNYLLEIEHDKLRGAGLSNSKSRYVKNVADFFKRENFQESDWVNMTDDEVLAKLTQIKGVGEWTAQMILIFKMNRPDVFPVLDSGDQAGNESSIWY